MTKPRIPNAIDTQRLQAMQLVARMKKLLTAQAVALLVASSVPMDRSLS